MTAGIGIYRNEEDMKAALHRIQELRGTCREIRLADRGTLFNSELLEILEPGNLLDLSLVPAASTLNKAGVPVADSPEQIPGLLKERLNVK